MILGTNGVIHFMVAPTTFAKLGLGGIGPGIFPGTVGAAGIYAYELTLKPFKIYFLIALEL
jgi:hypothetical protein